MCLTILCSRLAYAAHSLPYTFYWATDVYPVSRLAILILEVTRLWNLLAGNLPHTEQAHSKCGRVELTNHTRLKCSGMLCIVFLHASPTPAQETEPGRSLTQEHIAQLRAVENAILHTGRPSAPFPSQLPQWGQTGWHLSGGILEDLPSGETEQPNPEGLQIQAGSPVTWPGIITLQWSPSVDQLLVSFLVSHS